MTEYLVNHSRVILSSASSLFNLGRDRSTAATQQLRQFAKP